MFNFSILQYITLFYAIAEGLFMHTIHSGTGMYLRVQRRKKVSLLEIWRALKTIESYSGELRNNFLWPALKVFCSEHCDTIRNNICRSTDTSTFRGIQSLDYLSIRVSVPTRSVLTSWQYLHSKSVDQGQRKNSGIPEWFRNHNQNSHDDVTSC